MSTPVEDGGWGPELELDPVSESVAPQLTATATHRELVGLFQLDNPDAAALTTVEEEGAEEQVVEAEEAGGQNDRLDSLDSMLREPSISGSPTPPATEATQVLLDVFPPWATPPWVPPARLPTPPRLPANPMEPGGMRMPVAIRSSVPSATPRLQNARPTGTRPEIPVPQPGLEIPAVRPRMSFTAQRGGRPEGHYTERRRSYSNEFEGGEVRSHQEVSSRRQAEERLHALQVQTNTRRTQIVTRLVGMEETQCEMRSNPDTPLNWLESELREVDGELRVLEQVEMESWLWTARVQGPSRRASRSEAWTNWHRQVCDKMTALRRSVWTASTRDSNQ